MLSKLLYKTLSKIYSSENAMRFTILLISLISVATILICYPSLKLFMQGKPLIPINVIFFVIIGYVLYELFSCIKLQSNNEIKEQNLVTVIDNKKEVTTHKSFINLKDTFIFHQKKDYKIIEYLKKYESHLSPPESGDNKKQEVDITNIIGNENDELDIDVMDQMSEKDLYINDDNPDMDFLGNDDDFEVDLEELKKAQEEIEKNEIDKNINQEDVINTIETNSPIQVDSTSFKNRAEQKFDLMGDIGSLISIETKNNS